MQIAERIALGESLKKVTADPWMPSLRTVFTWCMDRPEFDRLLAHARLCKADVIFDQVLDVADEPVADATQAARQKTRVHARMWVAARLNPAKYAERVAVGGAPEFPSLQALQGKSEWEPIRRIAFALAQGQRMLLEHQHGASDE
ncbi:MAG: hypothetical protein AB1430_09210 [Pseudomonadota bacterium]